MAIDLITFDERYQKALVYGSFNQSVLSDGILNGCAISNTTSSMTVGAGSIVIGGRLIYFSAAETTNIVSPTGNYVRFYFKIDLTQTPSSTASNQGTIEYDYSATLGGFAALTQEDINEDGNTYECEIAVYSLSGGNINALTRNIGSTIPMACAAVFTASATFALGDVAYINSSNQAAFAKADAVATMGDLWICAKPDGVASGSSGLFVKKGRIRNDAWNWTPGNGVANALYVSTTGTTGNTITTSFPTGTNNVIQLIGYIETADIILFDPESSWMTHV